MRPYCQITANGQDITMKLTDYLLSIEVQDEVDDKSDSVTMELDDRQHYDNGAMLDIPLIGTVIGVTLGYVGGTARFMGSYRIDEIQVKPSPQTLTITGRAAFMHTAFRTARSQSYHQQTLGAICQEIALRNGYQAKLDNELASIIIRHFDQHNESDMAFITRLANNYDAVARPIDNRLVLAKRGTAKAISGEVLPIITLEESMCSDWAFQYSARDEAGEATGLKANGQNDVKGGVRAFYHDIRKGENIAVTVGNAPFHDLRYIGHNEVEAKSAIISHQNKSLRGKAGFNFEMSGNPLIMAEAKLIQSPAFRPYMPNTWRIKTVRHRFEPSSGYTTSADCEIFTEKQHDTIENIKNTKPLADDIIDPDAPEEALAGDDNIIHL